MVAQAQAAPMVRRAFGVMKPIQGSEVKLQKVAVEIITTGTIITALTTKIATARLLALLSGLMMADSILDNHGMTAPSNFFTCPFFLAKCFFPDVLKQ